MTCFTLRKKSNYLLSNVAPKGEYAALIANGCDTVEEPAT